MKGNDVLTHAGLISAEQAKEKAIEEYNQYKQKSADELSEVELNFIALIENANKQLNKKKGK